jgi:hypothetical protein
MTLHGPLPVPAALDVWELGLAADRGGIKNQFSPIQRHYPRRFWKPLVPTDANADVGMSCLPGHEAGVTGRKEVLLSVARPLWDMGLAIWRKHLPISVEHHQ